MARRARAPDGTLALLFFAPPTGLVSEMNFNSYEFLLKDKNTPNTFTVVSRETIASLILNPSDPNHNQLNNMLMRKAGGDGAMCPAHIPNVNDIYPIRSEFHIFLKWCLGQSFNPNNISPALHVLDPKPAIQFSEILVLEPSGMRLCIGTYTDAFQVVKGPSYPHVLHIWVGFEAETDIVPGYHKVDVTPFRGATAAAVVKGPCIPMPSDTLVCCWNVRGLARPSLVTNFQHLYELYKPGIVVLVESRQSMENVQVLVTTLAGSYSCLFYPPQGLCGGVVILWRNDIIAADQRIIHSDFVKGDVFFKGHPDARRKLF